MLDLRERIRATLVSNGFANLADDLLAASRPGVGFELSPGEGPPGTTRFGGSPELPANFKWPTHDHVNARFVAQINLAEVATFLPDQNPLPKDGLLTFFWWQENQYGYDPKGCRVHHFRLEGLRRTTDPWTKQPEKIGFFRRLLGVKPSEQGQGWRGCHATPRVVWSINHLILDAGLSARLSEDHHEFLFGDPDAPLAKAGMPNDGHRILGCAQPVQGAVEADAELESADGDERQWKDAAAKAGHWRCLLEVNSDPRPLFCFGDWGKLYFMMHDADLRAGRFDRVRIITQCH